MGTRATAGTTKAKGIQKALCWMMAVVMAVSLMPLPAYAAQSGASLTGGSSSLSTRGVLSTQSLEAATGFTGGEGTEENPYQINTASELVYFANQVNGGTNYAGQYIELTSDIDLASEPWTPIGGFTTTSNNKPFSGTFNGNGHYIDNLLIDSQGESYQALFGYLGQGAVLNGFVVTGSVTATDKDSAKSKFIAGVVAYGNKDVKITNVGTKVNVTNNSSASSSTTAGILAGMPSVTQAANAVAITNCYNSGCILTAGTVAGGITAAPSSYANIVSCYNSGDVNSTSSTATQSLGGIVGNPGTSKTTCSILKNCFNVGKVSTTHSAPTKIGSLSGYFLSDSSASNYALAGTSVQTISDVETNFLIGSSSANAAPTEYTYATETTTATDLLSSIRSGDYEDVWKSSLSSVTGYPELAWETTGVSNKDEATIAATIDGKESATLTYPATKNIAVSYAGDSSIPAISAVSSDDTIVTVGAYNPSTKTIPVTSVGSGTATITVTAAETDDYSSASATVSVTVTGGPTRYEVTFATDGGSDVATQKVNSGSTAKKPSDPTKNGYLFDGWYVDVDGSGTYTAGDKTYDFASTISAAISLVAKWVAPIVAQITVTPNTGKFTFVDMVTGETITPTVLSALYQCANLNPNHAYKMTGSADYYKDGETTFDFSGKTGTVTGTFTLSPMDYAITYSNLKGDNASLLESHKSYTYNIGTVTLPTGLVAEGYTFDGWYADASCEGTAVTTIKKGESGNKEFWAKWTPVEYSITYVLNEGENSEANPTSYTIETPTITLANPTRDAYYFRGWTADGITKPVRNLQIQQGSIGDKEFTANWVLESEITLANITYNAIEDVVWDGAAAESQYVEGEGYQLPSNLTRAGYAFKGWYDNEACAGDAVTEIPASATGAKEFWAKWVPTYTITWKNGGEVIETDEEVEYGSTPSFDGATPTQAEDDTNTYVFIGWDPEPAEVTGDATYVAKFDTVSKQSKTALGNVIATAQKTLAAATTTAESASDVAEGTHYVTAAQKQALQTAIAAAQATADNANATQAEVNKATQDLTSAITAFESAQEKQVGTKKAAATTTPTSTTQPTTPANTGNSTDKTATAGNTTATDKAGTTTTDNASKSSDSASTTKTDTSTTTKTATTTKTTTTTKAAKNVKASSGSAKVTVDISSNGTATIKAGKTTGKTVSINTVTMADGKVVKVTAIAANAFKGTSATKVTIGSNVKTIGAGAFANAKKLTTVTVGKNVKSIGKNAFKGAKKLKTVAIGKSVKSVGANAFKGCKKLKTLKISSTKLTKKACKNMLKGSSVKTIKLTGMSKAAKKKALKNYKKWFPKKVAGKKLVIK